MDDEECAGLFSPCANPVTHHLEDPSGKGNPVPLCDEHWEWTMDLERTLNDDPELRAAFALEVEKAACGGEQ